MTTLLLFFILGGIEDTLIIVSTHSLRGELEARSATFMNPYFPPQIGGRGVFAKFLQNETGDFLLFDSGNSFATTLWGMEIDPTPLVNFMNTYSYTAMTLGCDDLRLGQDNLKKLAKSLTFPIVVSNLLLRTTSQVPEWAKPYIILEHKGLKIGILGLISEYTPIFSPRDKLTDWLILKEQPAASAVVETLKTKGVDIIIAVSSIGFAHDKLLTQKVKGIDVILGGFAGWGLNEVYEDPTNHTLIVRSYGGLGEVAKLALIFKNKTLTGYNYKRITLFEEAYP